MIRNHSWIVRGVRALTALALVLSVLPVGGVSAAPASSIEAVAVKTATVTTAAVNSDVASDASLAVEQIRAGRSWSDWVAAAPAAIPPQAPNAVSIIATKRDALVNDIDNDGRADPGDRLRYTVVITNGGVTEATGVVFNDSIDNNTVLSSSVKATPLARNDAYTAVGNVRISPAAGSGVLVNDSDPDGSAISVVSSSTTSANGGNVAVNAGGSFTYNPPAGFEGTDTFTYTIQDTDGNQNSAVVSVAVSGMIWFINNNPAACSSGCDGRLTTPFTTLAAFAAINNGAGNNPAANDNIFVYESATAYTGGVTLLNGQRFIGQDATSSLATLTGLTPPSYSDALPAMNTGGNATTINGGTNAVQLAQGSALYGFTAGTATGASISGSNFGTLLVNGVIISTTGAGLSLGTGAFGSPATFTSITSGGGSNNVSLINVTGTANLGGGALSGATGHAFAVDGGTAVLAYSGTLNNTTARSVSVINKTGGSVTFFGAVNGSGQGVFLNNNTGATITFLGGLTLSTGSNAAFTATGGGTVNVCDENPCNPAATGTLINTLATTTGTALNVVSTTIGANDLEFRSISANGATNGIVLNNTGASGNLVVKGNGGSCASAGTCTGGAIQTTTGDGISLTNTDGVALTRLFVGNTGNHGINTSAINGLTLTSAYVTNAGNGDNEHGLNLVNVRGTVAIDGTTFNGASEDLVHLENNNFNVTLNVTNGSQFSYPASIGSFANSAFLLLSGGTAAITALIQNSTFTNVKDAAAQIGANLAGSNGTQNFTFSNNTINITLAGRASGVIVSGQESTTTNITIDNNSFNGAGGNGVISIDTNDSSVVRGTASNNTISNPPGIGMFIAVDEAAKSDVTLNGNTITNSGGDGIQAVNFGGVGVSTMDMTIINNQINGHSLNTGVNFVGGVSFTGFEDSSCLVLRGNTVSNTPASPTQCGGVACVDYYLDEAGGTALIEEVPNTAATTANAAYVNSINDPGPVMVFGVIDLTNGATCNVTGLGLLPESNQMLVQDQTEIDPLAYTPTTSASSNIASTYAAAQDLPVQSEGGNSKPLLSLPFNPVLASLADRAVVVNRVEAPIAPLNIGTLPAGKTITLTFEVVINNPMTPGVVLVSNQGTVSGDNFSAAVTDDPDTVTANDPTVTSLDIQVDLRITKTVNPATAYPGLPITYTITYQNIGPQASTNVMITDPIPSGLTGVSYQSSATITPTGSYQWTIGALLNGQGGLITVTGTISPALGVPTAITNTATITGTGRDTNSSNNSASAVLPIADQPISGLSAANDSPTQLGSATHFTATISTGTNVTYQWNFGDGGSGTGTTALHTYAAIGAYTATVTATNSNNSQVTATIVTVIDVPISGLNATNDGPTHLGNATSFNATTSTGSNIVYAWDFGDGATGSGPTPSHTYGALGTYTATITATNSRNQQTAATTVIVIDQPIGNLIAANDSPTPLGSATHFTATIGGGTNVTYQWNFGDGVTGSGATTSHTYGGVGSYVATVTATNGVSVVVATTNVSIIDRAIVGLSATNSGPTGLGNATIFTATISDGTNVAYVWNFGDGNTGTGAIASHTYAALGTYTATIIAANGVSTVTASTIAPVINQPISGLSAANSSPTRLGSATAFTATIATGSNVSYAWDFGDGSLGSGVNDSHTYGAVGTYTATVTATNNLNSQTASTVVVVIDRAIEGLSASNDSPTRLGSTTAFTATIGGGSNVTYQWNFGDGAIGSGANVNHVYGAVGGYLATVTATNGISIVVATTNVSIIDTPIAGLTAANSSPTSLGLSTLLTATIGSGSNVMYAWNFGDGALGSGANPSHIYPALGAYTATVTATNGVSHVVATTLVMIVDRPLSNLSVTSSSPTLLGSTSFFTATANVTSVVYSWDFGDGTPPATGVGASPSHIYAATGLYTVIVTATNGTGTLTATTKVNVFSGKVFLPLIARNYVSAPDLMVTSLSASPANVQVVIQNRGDRAATDGFYVDVYINPNPAPVAVNQIWSDGRSTQGLVWGVTSAIQPGQSITLTIGDAYYLADYSVFMGTLPIGTPVYAQVDSLDLSTTYGAVRENHEISGVPYNNILGPVLSIAALTPLSIQQSIERGSYWLPIRLKAQ